MKPGPFPVLLPEVVCRRSYRGRGLSHLELSLSLGQRSPSSATPSFWSSHSQTGDASSSPPLGSSLRLLPHRRPCQSVGMCLGISFTSTLQVWSLGIPSCVAKASDPTHHTLNYLNPFFNICGHKGVGTASWLKSRCWGQHRELAHLREDLWPSAVLS